MARRRTRLNLTRMIVPAIALPGGAAVAGPYPPAGGQSGSPAIAASSSSIVEWASAATIVRGLRNVANPTQYSSAPSSPLNYAFYGGSDGASSAASDASVAAGTGPITLTANTAPIGMPTQPQSAFYAVSLGQNGSATLSFNQPIANGSGYDFAVFGNGFSSGPSLEWVKPALVEVSSDGVHFFQFPSVSLTQTTTQVSSFGELDPTNLYDLAGKDPAGYGTPFDLAELAGVSPLLNVNAVTQVKLVSVTGNIAPAYATYDSQGNIINSPNPAASSAGSEGFGLAGVGVINVAAANPVLLTWSNASGTSAWTGSNWNNPGVSYRDGNAVLFDNSFITSEQNVTLGTSVSPAGVTVNNSTGSYTIAGIGGIAGSGELLKSGSQKLILDTVNNYSGATTVNSGTLELAIAGALPTNNALIIAANGHVVLGNNIGPLILSSLSSNGTFDLANNGLVIHNANLAAITAAVSSSTAAADTGHLTTVGVIQNITAANTALFSSTFDGATDLSLSTTDVLAKYTYFGDANLDGHVDASDYSDIDNGFLLQLTGWQNGDFNYDGSVNGSDYTLIDNGFDTQGANITATQADPVATITNSIAAVPEPVNVGLIAIGLKGLSRRRRSKRILLGFTIIELLVVIGIMTLLMGILLPGLYRARQQSQLIVCASNIRQLALANILYATDNHSYCVLAAADIFNDLGDGRGGHFRWHGSRHAAFQPFDPARGPLARYLGPAARVKSCPEFDPSVGVATGNNFEDGCGGYGYNGSYIGGRSDLLGYSPESAAMPAKLSQIQHSSEAVMFTDAGMAQPLGSSVIVTEYSFCEPPFIQENPGLPSTDRSWPSIHFRHHRRANVAWADGHVTAELPAFSNESYGLSPAQVLKANVGWFGPDSNHLFQIAK